ncbi:hypothetical protein [Candidatus Vampirococcus lugosii]|uniref:Uncharacterized protein n=1 Tax=Candidatus Vampirococcus lugosii TaxID=2789015 RepID=A0ABS5QNQ8_9BACT|nr:hypothetical protein [Candidatus Vampirococcus lugosii]MBS8122303.1 hypothetical protein [Candidatus Vampirococcus lugosii]
MWTYFIEKNHIVLLKNKKSICFLVPKVANTSISFALADILDIDTEGKSIRKILPRIQKQEVTKNYNNYNKFL